MTPADDPLEALRKLHTVLDSMWAAAPTLAAAIAAWEKERAERMGDAEGFAQKVDELTALRATVLAVAEKVHSWCDGQVTHHEWCGCQIAARLRKACE